MGFRPFCFLRIRHNLHLRGLPCSIHSLINSGFTFFLILLSGIFIFISRSNSFTLNSLSRLTAIILSGTPYRLLSANRFGKEFLLLAGNGAAMPLSYSRSSPFFFGRRATQSFDIVMEHKNRMDDGHYDYAIMMHCKSCLKCQFRYLYWTWFIWDYSGLESFGRRAKHHIVDYHQRTTFASLVPYDLYRITRILKYSYTNQIAMMWVTIIKPLFYQWYFSRVYDPPVWHIFLHLFPQLFDTQILTSISSDSYRTQSMISKFLCHPWQFVTSPGFVLRFCVFPISSR